MQCLQCARMGVIDSMENGAINGPMWALVRGQRSSQHRPFAKFLWKHADQEARKYRLELAYLGYELPPR